MKRLGTLWSLKVDQMTHAEVVTFLQEHGKQIENQIYFTKCHRPLELWGRFPSASERNRMPMEPASLNKVVHEHLLGFTH